MRGGRLARYASPARVMALPRSRHSFLRRGFALLRHERAPAGHPSIVARSELRIRFEVPDLRHCFFERSAALRQQETDGISFAELDLHRRTGNLPVHAE